MDDLGAWLEACGLRDPRGALAGAAIVLLVWILRDGVRGRRRRRRGARRSRRAARAEVDAEALLEAAGYQVLEAQVTVDLAVEVDGQTRPYVVRIDYLVRDAEGRCLVAEVKSGESAPDPLHVATRRQLLEYLRVVPDAEEVLLVDGERGTVHRVQF